MTPNPKYILGAPTQLQPSGQLDDSAALVSFPIGLRLDRDDVTRLARRLESAADRGRAVAETTLAAAVAQGAADATARHQKLAAALATYRSRLAEVGRLAREAEARAARAIRDGDDPTAHEEEATRLAGERAVYERRVAVAEAAAVDAEREMLRAKDRAAADAKLDLRRATVAEWDTVVGAVWEFLAARLDRIGELRAALRATGDGGY